MNKHKSIDHQLRATWQAVAKMYNEQAVNHDSTMSTAFVLLKPTSLSRILKNMEDKGAISREKNPDDGRSVLIKLTDYGKEMRKVSKGHVIQFNETVIDHVTEKDLEGFFKVTSVINKLIANKEIYKEISKKAV